MVERLVAGDYAALQRDGVIFNVVDPERDMVKHWVEVYPDTLVELPVDAWTWSDHSPPYDGPDIYNVIIAMWTAHQGFSDLSLEGEVHDNGGDDIRVEVHSVHVM